MAAGTLPNPSSSSSRMMLDDSPAAFFISSPPLHPGDGGRLDGERPVNSVMKCVGGASARGDVYTPITRQSGCQLCGSGMSRGTWAAPPPTNRGNNAKQIIS